MNIRTYITAWILLAIAVSLWVGVVFFVMHIEDMSAAREANIAAQKSSLASQTNDSMVYSTATETETQRVELDGFINVDPIMITKLLTTTAQSIGAPVTITSAGFGDGTVSTPQPTNGTPSVFSFETDSQGSFSSLIHTAQLFEALPAVSSIQQLDLIYVGDTGDVLNAGSKNAGAWHMNARIQMLTNSVISS